MNNYTYKCTNNVKDYCCIHHFICEVVDEILDSNKDYTSTTIVANGELAQNLLRILLSLTVDKTDGEFLFNMGMVEFNDIEYDKEYYISINSDFEVWCEPAYRKNKYGIGYVFDEADYTYIHENSNFKILDKIESDNVTIFGFEDEE